MRRARAPLLDVSLAAAVEFEGLEEFEGLVELGVGDRVMPALSSGLAPDRPRRPPHPWGCATATATRRADRCRTRFPRPADFARSEERRVGKECRSRWWREKWQKKRMTEKETKRSRVESVE